MVTTRILNKMFSRVLQSHNDMGSSARQASSSLVSKGICEGAELIGDGDGCDSVRGERALWRAVITQALMDAGSNSAKKEMKYDKAQAIAWLASGSKDFHQVCTLADMDPEYVRQKSKEAIKRGCSWRNKVTSNAGAKKGSVGHNKSWVVSESVRRGIKKDGNYPVGSIEVKASVQSVKMTEDRSDAWSKKIHSVEKHQMLRG